MRWARVIENGTGTLSMAMAGVLCLVSGCILPEPIPQAAHGDAGEAPTGPTQQPGNGDAGDEFFIVKGASYIGAIIPTDKANAIFRGSGVRAGECWLPTPEQIDKCESDLRKALERGAQNPEAIDDRCNDNLARRATFMREIPKILAHLKEYRRQYVGIVADDGSKRILINCLPGCQGDTEDEFPDWRKRFILVDDGGFWFWKIEYELGSGKYLGFSSNREA